MSIGEIGRDECGDEEDDDDDANLSLFNLSMPRWSVFMAWIESSSVYMAVACGAERSLSDANSCNGSIIFWNTSTAHSGRCNAPHARMTRVKMSSLGGVGIGIGVGVGVASLEDVRQSRPV